ncbi:MAG: SAM-dependent methyltransferase, partial [Sphingomicrobium sp.]
MVFVQILNRMSGGRYNSSAAYSRHLRSKLWAHRGNRDLAFAQAIGSDSVSDFIQQGDGHVAVLRHHGLQDRMSIYDLGCG